jgi:hypothetical protein
VHAVSLTPHARIFAFKNRSYLGEFEAGFKKALARASGAQGVLFDKQKPKGRKSRDTVPLTEVTFWQLPISASTFPTICF